MALKRIHLLILCLAGAVVTLSGCSATRIVNALTPRDTFKCAENIPFSAPSALQLDVYQPLNRSGATPVVVFVYGGNWDSGKRGDYLFVGEALASHGITVVIADYRLYPAVKYPDFLHDTASAISWTSAHIAEYGGDPTRIYVMGHSAGAYNAAMVLLDQAYLWQAGFKGPAPRGLIGLAGPYDFLPLTDPTLQHIFGAKENWPATQPIAHVRSQMPPTLLMTADEDEVVLPRNSEHFAAALRAQGNAVAWLRYADSSHAKLIGALSVPLRRNNDVLDQIVQFVQSGDLPPERQP